MKKRNLLFLFVFVFFMAPLISAFDWSFFLGNSTQAISEEKGVIDLSKATYEPREILQAEITKNFIDTLTLENIAIYKEGVPRSQPVISGLKKYGGIYYYYAILPNQEGNFSVLIQNTKYTSLGNETTDPIPQDFVIKRLNKQALQINPGIINILEENEFTIAVMSVSGNQKVTATLSATGESKELNLIEDVKKSVKFSTLNATFGETELSIGSYKIPVFIIGKQNQTDNNTTGQNLTYSLDINPSEINGRILAGENYFFKISLTNTGEKNITVFLSSELNVTIKPNEINLTSKEQSAINITLSVPKEQKDIFEGSITASFESEIIEIPVSFEITQNKTDVSINGSITNDSDCYKMGEICDYDQECEGKTAPSLQGPCCIGKCNDKQKSNFGFYIGFLILILIIGAGIYFYLKANKKARPKSSEDILMERQERFRNRMGDSRPVSGNLGRI